MKTEFHSLTVEDIKKCSEDLQRAPKRSEEAQEVYDTLFNYFSQMILNSDFVKVVRCKDCKHSAEYASVYLCFKSVGGVVKKADGFCDEGERRVVE